MCDLMTERRAAGRLTAKQEQTGLNFGWEPKYLISCHRITERGKLGPPETAPAGSLEDIL